MTNRGSARIVGPTTMRVVSVIALMLGACARVDPDAELAAARANFESGDFATMGIHVKNVLQARPADAAARVLNARLLLKTGDFAAAVAEFERAIGLGAPSDTVALPLAEAMLASGDHEGARHALEAAAPGISSDADYGPLLAEALLAGGSIDEAGLTLDRAVSKDGSVRAVIVRSRLASARRNPDDAEAILTQGLSNFPNDPELLAARGEHFVAVGRLREAEADLRLAADRYRDGPAVVREAFALAALVPIQLGLGDVANAEGTVERLERIARGAAVSAYMRGLLEHRRGRYQVAAEALRKAASISPQSPSILLLLGATHLALGNLGQAEQQLLGVLALVPNDPTATKVLAETRLRQRRPEAALEAIRPLAAEGTDPQAVLLGGLAALLAGNVQQGIELLEKTLAIEDSVPTRRLLAHVFAAEGRIGESERVLREMLADNPRDAQTLAGLAQLAFANNEVGDASNLLRQALTESPDSPPLQYALGMVELRMGDIDEALSIAAQLKAKSPKQAAGFRLEAEAHIARGEYSAAVENLSDAYERDPIWPLVTRLVSVLPLANKQDAVPAVLQEWTQRNPEHVPGLLAYGLGLEAAGATEDALSQYRRVLAIAPDHIVALNNAAWRSHELGHPEALAWSERARALAPDQPEVLDTLGWILLHQNREKEAIPHLEKAVEFAPQNLEIRYHLALAQAKAGQRDRAAATLQALLQNNDFEQRAAAQQLLETL